MLMGQVIAGGEQFETYIEADYRGKILQKGPDSGLLDAFGRQRFSDPFTLFDSMLRFSKRTDLWDEKIVGSGTTDYLLDESSLDLITTVASGDSVLRRSRRHFPYQPGKSLSVMASFVGNELTPGLVQEVGYFDDNNGVILRADGEEIKFVIRSFASGSVIEEEVSQSEWNIDTLPELDFSKANVFMTDLEWLGVGRVRAGFNIDGKTRYCHEFNHANVIDTVYMTSAMLPVSYKITNSSSIAFPSRLKQICSTVMSEGGYQPTGPIYIGGRGVGGFASISSETMVAAIRMASGRTDNIIIPAQIDASVGGNPSSNIVAQWQLRLNPTISGTWLPAGNGRGNVEVMSSGTFSGGTVIGAGLVASRSAIEFDPESGLGLSLGQDINGNSDAIILTIQCSSAENATGLLGWREVV
jgi:hypothetical protein